MKLIRIHKIEDKKHEIFDSYLYFEIKYNTVYYIDYYKNIVFLEQCPKNVIPKNAKGL